MIFSCEAGASWPDGEKVLNYLKEVDHLGLTGEIRFDSDGFRTDVTLDLIEKVRGRFRKTATWSMESGVNYTMTSEEIGTQMIEKLANRTLRVVTTPVSCTWCPKIFSKFHHFRQHWQGHILGHPVFILLSILVAHFFHKHFFLGAKTSLNYE